jgi:RNA polymerase sigma-70 factor, ECF subfamily
VSPSLEQRLDGDTSFERLYRRHRRDVYGAVLRDVRDPDEAEDVTQIAFMNAFRAIRRGEEPDKPRAWLVTIARNVVRRRYQVLARRPQEVALDPEVAADLADVDGPTAGEIAAAIRRLPPNQRAVTLLREIQGRSYAEIAEQLELSLAAVETLIFRARRSLSKELQLADHVPTTQRRTRSLRGLLGLPLPGLGKLSLGFSAGRAGLAALVGGVAIVTVPLVDVGANPPLAPAVQRAPSRAEMAGPSVAPGVAFLPLEKAAQARRSKTTVQPGDSGSADESSSGGGTLPSLPLPSVEPSSDVSVPALPVEPLPLPVEPPPLPVEPLPLPVEPPPLPSTPPLPLPT